MIQADRQIGACRHLGIKHDPASFIAFPSPHNYCHACAPQSAVNLEHQNEYCLKPQHAECVAYNFVSAAALPESLRLSKNYAQTKPKRISATLPVSTFIITTILALGFAITGFLQNAANSPELTSTLPQPATVENTPHPTSSLFLIPITGPTPTTSPSPFPTSPFPQFLLGSPLGRDNKYVIHAVLSGDSLDRIAEKYRSSIEAITASNDTLKSPIRAGMLIVVPLGVTDPMGLPAFQPYQVPKDQATVQEIAASAGADPELIKFHNGLEMNQIIPLGAWILIPREQKTLP